MSSTSSLTLPAQTSAGRVRAGGWSIGTRIALVVLAVQVVAFGAFSLALSASSMNQLESQARDAIATESHTLRELVAQLDDTMLQEADRFMLSLAAVLPGPYAVDPSQSIEVAGKPTPAFRSGDQVLNNSFDVPDKFFAHTGGVVATVFARTGDDFIRVTTSLKKQDGQRAVGTLLDRTGAAYAAVSSGKSYRSLAWLFGKPYMSKYEPVRDSAGRIVGALFVGVNVEAELAAVKNRIRRKAIGGTGQFLVIDARPGPDQGRVMVDRSGSEGTVQLDAKDSDATRGCAR
ncbi:Cache 3/Cache 2 fusion domain-containing protein [Cupriavidus pauculus]|uniref:Cache 3/Cache 2 fusion domain-containing protein n=1 Tax=Cupriavidus pauculus TaxID=82633 RepID=UPI001FD4BA57|nr:Cache 3/Cache 2 fusion domain-containing protein [Cupriavidus pauculus]